MAPLWLANAGKWALTQGKKALQSGFSAKSGSASLSYTPPVSSKTSGKGNGAGGFDMMTSPYFIGGAILVGFLLFKK